MRTIVALLAASAIATPFGNAAALPDAGLVRDQLDKYLSAYQPALSTVVAQETMTQRDGPSFEANRTTAPRTVDREIISEVAFIGLPGNAGWLGFRRVMTVNTRPIKDAGPSLAQLLTDGAKDDFDQARLLLTQSASHNLGMPRTTNLPNLPLEFLHPRNRHRFAHRVDGLEKIRGIETVRLLLSETSTPTIIQRAEGGDMPSLVTAWVEPGTGRLHRAQVKSRDARIGVPVFDAVVWVDFKQDTTVGMLVPTEMKEEFYAGRFREGTSQAKYTNYRRFQTLARVVPQ
jgi:hypothetical protein